MILVRPGCPVSPIRLSEIFDFSFIHIGGSRTVRLCVPACEQISGPAVIVLCQVCHRSDCLTFVDYGIVIHMNTVIHIAVIRCTSRVGLITYLILIPGNIFTFMRRQAHPLFQIVAEWTEIIVTHRFSFAAQVQVLYRGRRFSAHINIGLFNGFSTIRTIGFPAGIVILHAFLSAKRYPVPVFSAISIMNALSRPMDHFPISHRDFSIPSLCINMFSHYRISQRRRNLRIHIGAVIPVIPHIIPVSCAGRKCTAIRTERDIRTVVNGLFCCRIRLYRKQECNSQHE